MKIIFPLFILALITTPLRGEIDFNNFTHQEKDLAGVQAVVQNGSSTGDHLTIKVLMGAEGELNADAHSDAVAVCLLNGGGSGNFRELCLLLSDGKQLLHTDTAQLGDRIRMKSVAILDGVITVSYLDRRPDQSMAAPPTVEKRQRYRVKGRKLIKLQ